MAACNQVLPDVDIVCPVLKPIPNSVWEWDQLPRNCAYMFNECSRLPIKFTAGGMCKTICMCLLLLVLSHTCQYWTPCVYTGLFHDHRSHWPSSWSPEAAWQHNVNQDVYLLYVTSVVLFNVMMSFVDTRLEDYRGLWDGPEWMHNMESLEAHDLHVTWLVTTRLLLYLANENTVMTVYKCHEVTGIDRYLILATNKGSSRATWRMMKATRTRNRKSRAVFAVSVPSLSPSVNPVLFSDGSLLLL